MRKVPIKHGRQQAIEHIKQRLLNSSMPRLQMFLILSLAGSVGFIVSFSILHLGMTTMWVRYPLAVLLAYCAFILLLRLWLSYKNGRQPDFDIEFDSPGIDLTQPHCDADAEAFEFGGGGDFGGGGATDSWGDAAASKADASSNTVKSGGSGGFDLDLDEGWLIVLALIAIAGALVICLYIVYTAPVFLAEILLDSLLVAGLYKRLKGVGRRHWVLSALRRTCVPVILVMIFFAVAGYLLQWAAPDAHSIGEVWAQIASK